MLSEQFPAPQQAASDADYYYPKDDDHNYDVDEDDDLDAVEIYANMNAGGEIDFWT